MPRFQTVENLDTGLSLAYVGSKQTAVRALKPYKSRNRPDSVSVPVALGLLLCPSYAPDCLDFPYSDQLLNRKSIFRG